MSVHSVAEASQNFTWPLVIGVVPASTVAVSVTAVPGVTDAAGDPTEVTVMVVLVAGTWPQSGIVAEVLEL
jgi:hypothetical protein